MGKEKKEDSLLDRVSADEMDPYFVVRKRKGVDKAAGVAIDSHLRDSLGGSGSDVENSRYSGVFTVAESILERVGADGLGVGNLSADDKRCLFYYLSVFSPLVSRVVDLHTKLPMSSLRLLKPEHDVDIVQDYIYDHFNKFISGSDFKSTLRRVVRDYWVFGEGVALLEDDFAFCKDTVMDNLDDFKKKDGRDDEELLEINKRYCDDGGNISFEDKKKVLRGYLFDCNKSYKGVKGFKHVSFDEISKRVFNKDTDFCIYNLDRSDSVDSVVGDVSGDMSVEDIVKDLEGIGYSKGFINLHIKESEGGKGSLVVDNDSFNDDGVYVVRLASSYDGVDDSFLNRVCESAVQNLLAMRANNRRVKLAGKVSRLVNIPGNIDRGLIDKFDSELVNVAESEEGDFLVSNFDSVDVSDLDVSVKENLDLSDIIERTENDILGALGVPSDLVRDGASYGGSFLKVELLSNEYVEFRNRLSDFIENQIFKPVAIKMGFLGLDEWGEVVPIIPSVRFDKFSISRQSEDLALVRDLVQDKKLPASVLLELLGYNVEDIEQRFSRERNSRLNDSISDMEDNAIGNLSDRLSENEAFVKKLFEDLGYKYEKPVEGDNSGGGGGYGGGRRY